MRLFQCGFFYLPRGTSNLSPKWHLITKHVFMVKRIKDSNDNRGTYKPTHKVNNTTKRRCVFQQAIAFSVLMLHKNAKIVNDFHIILMTNI